MNCSQARESLSAYYDGQLQPIERTDVQQHLATCEKCAAELAGYQQVSSWVGSVGVPEPPPEIWGQLATQLDRQVTIRPTGRPWLKPAIVAVAVTASVLLVAGLGWIASRSWDAPSEPGQMAATFARYLEHFADDPRAAHEFLAATYGGTQVDIDEATRRLGYRPAVAEDLPDGYKLVSTHLMQMPCCNCVGGICQRSDGSTLAIFEHGEQQPEWYGDRPSISATCCGRRCSLMQMDSDLVAGWKEGSRHITVIGARDLEEINQLVAWLDDRRKTQGKDSAKSGRKT